MHNQHNNNQVAQNGMGGIKSTVTSQSHNGVAYPQAPNNKRPAGPYI